MAATLEFVHDVSNHSFIVSWDSTFDRFLKQQLDSNTAAMHSLSSECSQSQETMREPYKMYILPTQTQLSKNVAMTRPQTAEVSPVTYHLFVRLSDNVSGFRSSVERGTND